VPEEAIERRTDLPAQPLAGRFQSVVDKPGMFCQQALQADDIASINGGHRLLEQSVQEF
jgi:hypothetical protein